MSRSSKVISLSLPPEVLMQIDEISQANHQTRSEFFRRLIQNYSQAGEDYSVDKDTDPKDNLALHLKRYWDARSQQNTTVTIVGLAIISNPIGKVLIGARREPDTTIKKLKWAFIGGGLSTLGFSDQLEAIVADKSAVDIQTGGLISARIHPESTLKQTQVVALYFDASTDMTEPPQPNEHYSEFKFVEPLDVFDYFTTSTSDEVTRFLAVRST